jgi:hypothetical protein
VQGIVQNTQSLAGHGSAAGNGCRRQKFEMQPRYLSIIFCRKILLLCIA